MNVLATKLKVYRIRGGHTMRSLAKQIGVSATVICHAENGRKVSAKSSKYIQAWVSVERQRKVIEDYQQPSATLPASPNFYAFNKTNAEREASRISLGEYASRCYQRIRTPTFVMDETPTPKFYKGGLVDDDPLKKGDIHYLLFSYWITIGLVALIAAIAVWMFR